MEKKNKENERPPQATETPTIDQKGDEKHENEQKIKFWEAFLQLVSNEKWEHSKTLFRNTKERESKKRRWKEEEEVTFLKAEEERLRFGQRYNYTSRM